LKNKLILFFKANFLAITFGLVLFFGYSVFCFFNQTKLNAKIIKLNNELKSIQRSDKFNNSELEITKTFLRTRLQEFNLRNYSNHVFSSDSIKQHDKSIILVYTGSCGTCFDNELPIWNDIYQKVKNHNYFMIAINASKQVDLAKKYSNEKSSLFPIVNADESFFHYKSYPFVEMITFVVQPDLVIEEVHISMSQNIEYTKKFSNDILKKFF
jgi:hypothetical protein